MSFGGQSNTPWQRNIMPFQNVAPQQMYMQSSNYGGQIYGNAAGNASVAYPQTYNSIGTVTKINNDCGLVNDEVFFYRNVCKGAPPKLGDRVLFEATMSTTGQFKWNATRIQSMAPQPLMATAISGVVDHKGSNRYSNVAPSDFRGSHHSPVRDRSFRAERRDREQDREREHLRRSRDRDDASKMVERDRKRRREDVDRSREPEREDRTAQNRPNNARRDRDLSNERKERERKERMREREREHDRERERDREKEPKGRGIAAIRALRRYKVQIPKHSLACHELTIPDLRQRYPALYIPSLFFHADVLWPQTFTFEKPFSLRRTCHFHLMHESVEPLVPFKKEELEPNDVDYSYSAKVILLDCPSLAETYEKCFKDDCEESSMHLSRVIRFLFGTRGDNSPMAIGGYWSPSLDGPNPGKDPAVLIRTAIRTCKALTSIDLSNCTQWYRFCEYHYESEKNSSEPARVETVVIYLPDIHSCMPTVDEWQKLTSDYKSAAENLIANREQLVAAANNSKSSSNNDAEAEAMDTTQDEKTTSEADGANADAAEQQDDNTTENDESTSTKNQSALDASTDGEKIENEKDSEKNEPTHYSKLDLKSMKVQEMRDELIARNLPAKGVRTVIMARLAKAINTEKAEEIQAKKEARFNSKLGAKKDSPKAVPSKTTHKTTKSPQKNEKKDNDDDVQIISDDNDAGNKNVVDKKEEKNVSKSEEKSKKNNTKSSEQKNEEQDDQEESAGGADVDMNDLVILDEYDSRKNPEETQIKEFTEKDKERIMRRHTLPSIPHIVVHPNKAAKSGKFDCVLTSLSALLEYGPGDSKQRFFEVALFAELFKEMLMRDFSFNIYKEIYFHNQAKGNVQNESESTEKNSTNNKEDKNAPKNEEKASKENNGDGKSEEGQSVKSSSKRKANDEKEKESIKENKHMVTVKPHLLLSFLFFDSTHCGYIYKRDLEEMFYLCGLSLSRAQIHNFLDKVTAINAFHYREITDREGKPDETPTIEDIEEVESETLKKISLGNFALFDDNIADGEENEAADALAETEDGLINYNGTVVHVGKLVNQIKRTEKSLSDMEKLYNDIRKEHTDLQRTHTKTNIKMKDLQSEVKSLSHKLADTNRDLNSVNRKYREEHSALTLVYNRLTPFVGRDKERDHKSESSRKDKGKEKSKEESKKENEKSDKNKDKTTENAKDEEKESKKNGEDTEKSETKTENDEDPKAENNGENSESVDASNNEEENEEDEDEIMEINDEE